MGISVFNFVLFSFFTGCAGPPCCAGFPLVEASRRHSQVLACGFSLSLVPLFIPYSMALSSRPGGSPLAAGTGSSPQRPPLPLSTGPAAELQQLQVQRLRAALWHLPRPAVEPPGPRVGRRTPQPRTTWVSGLLAQRWLPWSWRPAAGRPAARRQWPCKGSVTGAPGSRARPSSTHMWDPPPHQRLNPLSPALAGRFFVTSSHWEAMFQYF